MVTCGETGRPFWMGGHGGVNGWVNGVGRMAASAHRRTGLGQALRVALLGGAEHGAGHDLCWGGGGGRGIGSQSFVGSPSHDRLVSIPFPSPPALPCLLTYLKGALACAAAAAQGQRLGRGGHGTAGGTEKHGGLLQPVWVCGW